MKLGTVYVTPLVFIFLIDAVAKFEHEMALYPPTQGTILLLKLFCLEFLGLEPA